MRTAVEPMSPRLASTTTSKPAFARMGTHALECREPVPAQRLEARHLWLDRNRLGGDGVDHLRAEPLVAPCTTAGTRPKPGDHGRRQVLDPRIEPDAQRAAGALDCFCQAVAEVHVLKGTEDRAAAMRSAAVRQSSALVERHRVSTPTGAGERGRHAAERTQPPPVRESLQSDRGRFASGRAATRSRAARRPLAGSGGVRPPARRCTRMPGRSGRRGRARAPPHAVRARCEVAPRWRPPA